MGSTTGRVQGPGQAIFRAHNKQTAQLFEKNIEGHALLRIQFEVQNAS